MGISVGGEFVTLPAEVVDKYLPVVSGSYIRVLIAAIRENSADISRISKFLSLSESDVSEALGYWKSVGVLSENTSELPKRKTQPDAVKPSDITSKRVAEQVRDNNEIKFLLCTAESLYGRPLTSTEQKGLVYINEVMGLPADVIIMAVEYCILDGKSHFNYIQKLCAGWVDDEIITHARAEAEIKKLNLRKSREGKIRTAFGTGDHAFTATQKKYINLWFDYGFDVDMIKLAYERTVDNTGKVAYPYIDKILQSWKEKEIFTEKDLLLKETVTPKQKVRKSDASYDLEEFEKNAWNVPE